MNRAKLVVALLVAVTLAGCGGGMAVGPQGDTLESEMTAPNPMAVGEINDATGTMIP
jgi:hypothetical protein